MYGDIKLNKWYKSLEREPVSIYEVRSLVKYVTGEAFVCGR